MIQFLLLSILLKLNYREDTHWDLKFKFFLESPPNGTSNLWLKTYLQVQEMQKKSIYLRALHCYTVNKLEVFLLILTVI